VRVGHETREQVVSIIDAKVASRSALHWTSAPLTGDLPAPVGSAHRVSGRNLEGACQLPDRAGVHARGTWSMQQKAWTSQPSDFGLTSASLCLSRSFSSEVAFAPAPAPASPSSAY
jgi:hypothetical protein